MGVRIPGMGSLRATYVDFRTLKASPKRPPAGFTRLFVKGADGDAYQLEADGTETALAGGGGGGYAEGTAFPGSPATNAKFYRTDRNLLYYFDGTRWLTTTLYQQHLRGWSNVSATDAVTLVVPVWEETYDQYLVDLITTMDAISGLSASDYWTIKLQSFDGATSAVIVTVTNQSLTSNIFIRRIGAINALLGTSIDAIEATLTKVGAPGNFYGGAMVTYRLVG